MSHRQTRQPAFGKYRLLLAACLALQGCAGLQGAPKWSPAVNLESDDALHATYLEKVYKANSDQDRGSLRNQFIEIRVGLIDQAYLTYKQSLYTQRVGSSVSTDIATLLLNAVGAGVSDVSTKTATSALSAVIIGSKVSIDKNVYFDTTLPALLSQMDARRDQVLARIRLGMLVDTTRYPMLQARRDLDDYYNAGSIFGAISSLTKQSSNAQVAAEQELIKRLPTEAEITEQLKGQGFLVSKAADTQTSRTLEKCLTPEAKLKPGLQDRLYPWLKTNGLDPAAPGTPVSDFLTSSETRFEKLRQQALDDPQIGSLIRSICK
ncbi:hypothetical protein [Azohydromonas aeria]|uniref:hypothetical protein n=1 Tax=Azohydromonas aeria TaxID=2590212 RepID=UPI0012F791CE|nr:hypothetical protein [Azohydromonas aeria]